MLRLRGENELQAQGTESRPEAGAWQASGTPGQDGVGVRGGGQVSRALRTMRRSFSFYTSAVESHRIETYSGFHL